MATESAVSSTVTRDRPLDLPSDCKASIETYRGFMIEARAEPAMNGYVAQTAVLQVDPPNTVHSLDRQTPVFDAPGQAVTAGIIWSMDLVDRLVKD
jgi:hypothetical protein